MRLGIVGEGLIERLLLRLGVVPTPLVLGYWGMGASRCILTATHLGVFEVLEGTELSAEEVAERLGCDAFGCEVLLNALNGFGYVRRRDGRYTNRRVASRWLNSSARFSLKDSVLFYDDLWDVLSAMTESVRTGRVENLHYAGRSEEFWSHYLRGLGAFARFAAPEISRVRLPQGAKRLLDVGGGHGLYSAAFVRRTPGLTAEVLDLPEACALGRAVMAEEGLAERVTFREGDAREAPWGEGYDVVLLFNVLHNLSPEECGIVLRRAHEALSSRGVLVVLEGEHEGSSGDLSVTAGMNELLFFLTSGTRTYPEDELRRWMAEAGFALARTRRLLTVPMTALITATKE